MAANEMFQNLLGTFDPDFIQRFNAKPSYQPQAMNFDNFNPTAVGQGFLGAVNKGVKDYNTNELLGQYLANGSEAELMQLAQTNPEIAGFLLKKRELDAKIKPKPISAVDQSLIDYRNQKLDIDRMNAERAGQMTPWQAAKLEQDERDYNLRKDDTQNKIETRNKNATLREKENMRLESKAPTGYKWKKSSDGEDVLVPIPGFQKVGLSITQDPETGRVTNISYGGQGQGQSSSPNFALTKPTVNAVQKDQISLGRTQEGLADIRTFYKPEFLGYASKGKNAVLEFASKLGLQGEAADKYLSEYNQFHSSLKQFFQEYKKSMSGLQSSEKELESIKDATVNGELSAPAFQARLKTLEFKTVKARAYNNKLLEQGLDPNSKENREKLDAFLMNSPTDNKGMLMQLIGLGYKGDEAAGVVKQIGRWDNI